MEKSESRLLTHTKKKWNDVSFCNFLFDTGFYELNILNKYQQIIYKKKKINLIKQDTKIF